MSHGQIRENNLESVKQREDRCNKISDEEHLAVIREITDRRATCRYRRLHELPNIKLIEVAKEVVNHKRVYQIMKLNKLFLTRHVGKRTLNQDGKIITLLSDTRWCSDAFTIQCWKEDWVHVAFSLDTYDREAIGYVASTVGVDGKIIRDLMVESVEAWFGNVSAVPKRIQWLSDNGPGYVANKTVSFARTLNLEPCTTPAPKVTAWRRHL